MLITPANSCRGRGHSPQRGPGAALLLGAGSEAPKKNFRKWSPPEHRRGYQRSNSNNIQNMYFQPFRAPTIFWPKIKDLQGLISWFMNRRGLGVQPPAGARGRRKIFRKWSPPERQRGYIREATLTTFKTCIFRASTIFWPKIQGQISWTAGSGIWGSLMGS